MAAAPVRQEDAGPFAKGLKALDPAGGARAEAACADAAERARCAQQKAELQRLNGEPWGAVRLMNRCMDDFIRYRESHPAAQRDPEIERLLLESIRSRGGTRREARSRPLRGNMLRAPETPASRRE
jgi:hypothetical protein